MNRKRDKHRSPPRERPQDRNLQNALAAWWSFPPVESHRGACLNIADLVSRVSKKHRFEKRRIESEIALVWDKSIAPGIDHHARPVKLVHGTLIVNVDNNTWLHDLVRYHNSKILESLQASFGSKLIQRISFRIG